MKSHFNGYAIKVLPIILIGTQQQKSVITMSVIFLAAASSLFF